MGQLAREGDCSSSVQVEMLVERKEQEWLAFRDDLWGDELKRVVNWISREDFCDLSPILYKAL